MKRYLLLLFLVLFCFSGHSQDFADKSIVLFSFPLDFEIQNDQGDMNTKEYLKNYGTKRKSRALEEMYDILVPFIKERLLEEGLNMLPCDELGAIKSNPYGIPSMMINKAVKSCEEADYFLKIALKDITVINPNAPQQQAVKMRTITVRCRISLLDRNKKPVKSLEAKFDSGSKIETDYDIGIDVRKITGPEREQELKIYETCCKMAFLLAMERW